MDLQTIKNELWAIGKSYPTVAGLMMKELPQGGTVGGQWAAVMHSSNLDGNHFSNVCYEYANFEKPIPQPADQLAFDVIAETKDRKWKDDQRTEQFTKYHQTKKKIPWRDDNREDRFCQAMRLAYHPDPLTETQVDELTQWANHDGPRPGWME